jgi:hypothetical protein
MRIRDYHILELDRRGYVATAVEVPPALAKAGVTFVLVLARRDGTEPLVLHGFDARVECSCGGSRTRPCPHVAGLMHMGAIRREEVFEVECIDQWGRSIGPARPQRSHTHLLELK